MKTNWLRRIVGLVIALIALAAATLLWFAVSPTTAAAGETPTEGVILGIWHFFYDKSAPPLRVLLVAVALALLFAAGIALLERRVTNKSRRSTNVADSPLSPRNVMNRTRGVYAGPVTVTVLVPAHNEEDRLDATLTALLARSRRPDRVIVVADNCTDGTARIARGYGLDVFESVGNTKKKAGALNQVLKKVLPDLGDNDIVMVMDADTMLDDGFLEVAVRRFTDDRALMAIGGLFYGEEGFGLIGQFQRNEYIRYSREIARRRGRVFVLTGTASMFRSSALGTIAERRGVNIPGTHGDVYDTAALTEDNELTIALKSLGGLMISPPECTVVTELMPTWGKLWRQRLRWQRGALENLGGYGVTPPTFRYWAQQLGIGYSVIALGSFFLLTIIMVLSVETWVWFPFWLVVGAVFIVERVVTAWKGGWRARLLAAALLPELCYDMFLDIVYVRGIIDITLGRQAAWGHTAEVVASDSPKGA